MDKEKQLEAYLELCKDIYERLVREGDWDWIDSLNPEDLVKSEDNLNDI